MQSEEPIAVLVSGGLDSSILLGEMVRTHRRVHPLFVRSGLYWETVELDHLKRYLEAIRCPALQSLQILEAPITDICPDHWSVRGRDVPDENSPDEAVYIPGRNVLLLSKAVLWCHLNRVPAVAMGTLSSNPFPDATPAFFDSFERVVNAAIGGNVRILRPYAHLHKSDVMARGRGLPLQFTFACLRPVNGLHCGRCNKCQERRMAFRDVGMVDRTRYSSSVAEASGSVPFRIGDRVVRNPATWQPTDFDAWGRGVGVGHVVEPPFPLGPDEVDVRWPGGRCFEWVEQLLPAPSELGSASDLSHN